MSPKKKYQHWSDRISTYLLYALIVLVPAVFTTNLYTTFSAPKLLLLHLFTCVISLIWGGKIFTYQEFEYKKSPLNIFLALSAVVALIATLSSTAFYSSLFGTYGRFIGLLTVWNFLLFSFIVANHFNKKNILTALLTSVVTASGLAIYGLVQYFNYFQETFNWSADPSERVFGTMGHPNHFGVYLGINIILGITLFSKIKNRLFKSAIFVGLILQAMVLLLTASRAAIVSTVIAAIVVLVFLAIKHRATVRLHLSRFILGLFILTVLGGTIGIIYQQEIAEFPLIKRTTDAVQNIQKGNIPDRLSWWYSGLNMIADKPILGFGLSTFHDSFNQYRRTDFHTLEQDGMEYHITPETAHNEFINVGATQGIVGLAIFLAMIITAYYLLGKKYLKDSSDNISLAILGALTVFIVDVFFGFGVVATYFFFYLLLGLAISISNKETKKSSRHFSLCSWGKYPVALLIIFIGILGLFGTARFGLSEYYYKEAIKAQFAGQRNDAIENFERAIVNKPNERAFREAFASYALQSARNEQAIKQDLLLMAVTNYEESIIINPHHPSSYFNLATVYLNLYATTGSENYLQLCEQNLQISVEKAVNNPLYPYFAGVTLMALDTPQQLQSALSYFKQASSIKPHYLDTDARILQIAILQ